MRIEFYKAYNQVHTWTGILSGLFLYVCFLTGALTMLKLPLNQWALQTEASFPPIERDQYDHLIQQVLTDYPEARKSLTVYLPLAQPQIAPLTWSVENEETHSSTIWQASLDDDNNLLVERASFSAIGDFFDHIHRTAGIPGGEGHDAIGTYVMGIVAALYFFAMVSGLIIFLPTWFKDIFSLRQGKNRKRYWLDFHNILGISALPFHLIIAITTVAFAYHDLFYDSLREMVYKETPMFSRPPANTGANISDLATISELERGIQRLEPEFEIAQVRLNGIGTPRASALVGGDLSGQWVRGPDYAYAVSNPYTGEAGYTAMLPSQSGFMGKVVNGFFTLHFGGFGGEAIRWVYVALGLSGALLFFTGNLLWIETRRKKQKKNMPEVVQNRSCLVMARLTVGVTLGTLVGIIATLLCVKWLPHQQYDIQHWQQATFYFGFLLCVAWASLQAPMTAALGQLKVVCGLLLILLTTSIFDFITPTTKPHNIGFTLLVLVVTLTFVLILLRLKSRIHEISNDSVWSYAYFKNTAQKSSPITISKEH